MSKKVGFVSLGCPKNLVDSEVMMGLLEGQQHEITPDKEHADIIVVNTCGFIDAAKQESIDTILEMAQYKQTGRCQRLIVTGCLVERYRQELQQEIPEVDAFLGTNEVEQIIYAAQLPQVPIPATTTGNTVKSVNGRAAKSRRALPVISLANEVPANNVPLLTADATLNNLVGSNLASEGKLARYDQLARTSSTADFVIIPGTTPARETDNPAAAYLYNDQTPRKVTTPRFSAYIKISEGCEHPCTFCIIPQLRGDFRSRRMGSIISEAEKLAAQGVKELVLIAQDSTWYGEDLGIKNGLATLLQALTKVDGIEWIRFLYSYPSRLSNAVLDVMAAEPKLCKYVDIPLQHASTRMLKAMKRPGNREFVEKLVLRMRARVPGIALRTTFIVGFPGETEADFQELMDFCRQMEFDRLGAFTYSDEEGTPAYQLPDKVPARTAAARQRKLMQLQSQISKRRNKQFVGKEVTVLFEGVSRETDLLWQGRMQSQAPDIDGCVLINDAPEGVQLLPGQFVKVKITAAHEHDLVGHVVE